MFTKNGIHYIWRKLLKSISVLKKKIKKMSILRLDFYEKWRLKAEVILFERQDCCTKNIRGEPFESMKFSGKKALDKLTPNPIYLM
jgi:hypothetical protein